VLSLFLPKIYRATTSILISESKMGKDSPGTAFEFSSTLPTFIPFVDNDALIAEAIKKFHLDQSPYKLTLDKFRRRDYLDVRIPTSTRLLEVRVEFPNANLAAALANYLAQGAVDYNARMNAEDTLATQNFLKQHLDQATRDLTEAARRQLEVHNKARIEDREKQLNILLSEKAEVSTQLLKLRLGLAKDQSKAKALEQALKTQPRTFALTKSLTDDRYLERVLGKLSPEGTPPPSMTEETLNTARQITERDFVDAQANAAAEAAEIQTASARLAQVNGETSKLLGEVTRFRSEIDRTDHDYTLARETVETATRNYQSASVTVSSRSQDLKQLAPALVPERPVRPRVLLNTLLGSLLGLLLLSGVGMVIESFQESRRDSVRFIEEHERISVPRG
jgi:polysaccharide biosynthesis transport protein